MALRAKQRIVVTLEEIFLFFSDNSTTFWADEILVRLSKFMILFTLISLSHKCVALRTLSADFT